MKKTLIALVFASLTATAQPLLTPPAPAPAASLRDALKSMPLPPAMTAILPDSIRLAEQAAQTGLDYRAGDEQTLYYTEQGNKSAQPAKGGYTRKILGKTADGRVVVQDYRQEREQPLTAPYALQKDADPADFHARSADSKIVHYRADGSIASIIDVKGGKPASRLNFYEGGKLVAQSPRMSGIREEDPYDGLGRFANEMRAYYPDGRLMAVTLNRSGQYLCLMYRPDGTPLAAFGSENSRNQKENIYTIIWNHDGKRTSELDVDPADREQAENISKRLRHISTLMEDKAESSDAASGDNSDGEAPRLFKRH